MKQRRFYTLLITAFMLLSANLLIAQKSAIKQLKLDNGLSIILNEDHSKKEVFGMLVVKAGAKNDPKDATGMAHYQEHMLFKGTTELGTSDWEKEKPHIDRIIALYDKLGATKDDSLRLKIQKEINVESIEAGKYSILNETSSLINQMGGTNMNAGTGWDQTVFYNAFPPNQIERWASLYSHRFMNPVFRAFQSELETVYEEKNMYQDNFITSLLDAFNKNFYKKHPYGQQTIIGTTENLKNPSLTKMYEFFKTYYVANNMALVLIGDFDTETVLPMLKAKFGQWKSGDLPKKEHYVEAAFEGREQVTGKYSPIKMAMLGFRTVPEGHADELPLTLFNKLIFNEQGTGTLNKLVQNGKVMAVEAISMHYQDYGADIFLVIPKLIGQKMRTAENLALKAIQIVRDGDFDEAALQQAKKEMYVSFQLEMEDPEVKANSIAQLFLLNKEMGDLEAYPARINAITKADILRVAKKYYGDNYLAFYSKMGSPKKEKLSKPQYDPIENNTNAVSSFAKKFQDIAELEVKPDFVDFEKDIESLSLGEGLNLYCAKNSKNDIYTSTLVFKVGNLKIKEIDLVVALMNRAGTTDMSRDDLQTEFAKIGCTYEFSSDSERVILEISGLEKDLDRAYQLIGKLTASPQIKEKDLEIAMDDIISERKYEREDPAGVAQALVGQVMYGDKSSTIHRMRKKDIKHFEIAEFNRIWSEVFAYECDIHYTGSSNGNQVKEMIAKHIKFTAKPTKADQSGRIQVKDYQENLIYFVNRKDAIQSNIYFLVNGKPFAKEEVPAQEAFNSYFGGGFSGLVLQEIREYRSLAYSAGAWYVSPNHVGLNNYFIGMIGTQADKTLDAMQVFYDLKKDMPEKPERMSFIQPYLAQTCITARPTFRNLTFSIASWKEMGYDADPSILIDEKAKTISFDDISKFYKKNIKDQAIVTMIVGDKSKIDLKKLAEYGKIKFIKEKDLYTK